MNALANFARGHAVGASQAILRGLALFFGTFSVLNVIGDWRTSGFDANLWWIDLRLVPEVLAQPFLLLAGGCLIAYGLRPPLSVWRRSPPESLAASRPSRWKMPCSFTCCLLGASSILFFRCRYHFRCSWHFVASPWNPVAHPMRHPQGGCWPVSLLSRWGVR